MNNCENYICGYISRFVKNNWNKIDKETADIFDTKEKFCENIKNSFDLASWILTEVMVWSMDKNYLNEMKVQNNEDGFIAQFTDDKYIKFTLVGYDWEVKFVEPKTKEVIYFE